MAVALSARSADRAVRVADLSIGRGQTNCLQIRLEAQGDENALGLSLCFDTNHLTFISARRGVDATAATLNVNSNQATRGRVGLALSLGFGQNFAPGPNTIVEVCFRAANGSGHVTTPISICDLPVGRELSDVEANLLTADYVSGSATLVGQCAFTLESSGASFSSSGGLGAVALTTEAGCAWSALNTNSWITLLSSAAGVGSSAISYLVTPNPTSNARTGTVMIASRPYVVSQLGIFCDFALTPAIRVHGPEGSDGQVNISANSACFWTVQNPNGWILVTSAASGMGDGVLTYSVAPYVGFVARTGFVSVAGQTLSVVQLPVPCTFSLSPNSRTHPSISEFNIVDVFAPEGCDWTIDNRNEWILIKLTTNGTGTGIARYTIHANDRPVARSGIITIAGLPFTVNQLPAPCTFSLLQTSRYLGAEGGTGLVQFATLNECPWVAINTNAWIEMPRVTNGIGGGSLGWAAGPNFSNNERRGFITVAGRAYQITQFPINCSSTISPTSRAIGSGTNSGTISVSVSAACSNVQWRVYNPNPWISTVAGTAGDGNGSVSYTVQTHQDFGTRTGILHVADRRFVITQTGIPCSYSVSPTSRAHTYNAESGTVNVNATGRCSWTARSDSSWLTITTATNGAGNGVVGYQMTQNTGAARSGRLIIQGQNFTVNQAAATAISITTQPANQNVAINGSATFRVVATGTAPISYQWRLNGINLTNRAGISGVTTSNLVLTSIQPNQAGNYSVVVSNLRGSVTSANALLRVNTPPTIAPIADRSTVRGAVVAVTVAGTDADLPAQTIAYSLAPGAPSGAAINATSGLFTWTAAATTVPTNFNITVRAADNGTPPLTNSRTFAISVVPGYITNRLLVPFGANWRYRDTGENLGTAWTALGYNDSTWTNGPAPLGYGNGNEATVVGFGPDQDNRYTTTYFRTRFNMADAAGFTSLGLRFRRDDGVVFHVNGGELFRENMPAGPITYTTVAAAGLGTDEEGITIVSPALDASRLATGDNVLSVEVHNRSASSGDIAIDAELTGIQTVTPPALLAHPAPLIVGEGMDANFVISAASALPKSQQWFFNGDALPGQTNELLIVPQAGLVDAGGYCAVVANALGSVTSLVASLTITQAPNRAPVIAPIANRTILEGSTLSLTAFAFDLDQPGQSLFYSLDPGAPAGAIIDPLTGQFTWTPAAGHTPVVNPLTIRATDTGFPPGSGTVTFNVSVVRAPRLVNISLLGGSRAAVSWESIPGRTYRVQYSTNLEASAWLDLPGDATASAATTSVLDPAVLAGQRFYRVLLVQ